MKTWDYVIGVVVDQCSPRVVGQSAIVADGPDECDRMKMDVKRKAAISHG